MNRSETQSTVTTIEDQDWKAREDAPRLREIYFAGGCFWGVESYFSQIPGVQTVTAAMPTVPSRTPPTPRYAPAPPVMPKPCTWCTTRTWSA